MEDAVLEDAGLPTAAVRTTTDRHLRTYHCDICNDDILRSQYSQHLQAKHGMGGSVDEYKPYHCTQCRRKFTKENLLNMHVHSNHTNNGMGRRPYVCKWCRFKCSKLKKFKQHILQAHPEQKLRTEQKGRADPRADVGGMDIDGDGKDETEDAIKRDLALSLERLRLSAGALIAKPI